MADQRATAMSSWLRALKITIERAGLDAPQLFREAGLDIAALDDPQARYPVEGTTRLWRLVRRATGDSAIGLRVADNIDNTTFNVLGYALLASPTLLACFQRIERYFRIVTNAADVAVERDGAHHRLVVHMLPGRLQPADEAEDALLCVLVGVTRHIYGAAFPIECIEMRRPEPEDTSTFKRVFAAPLRFGQAATTVTVATSILEKPLPSGNAELARYSDTIMAEFVARLDRDDIVHRVHAAIIAQLPYQEPDANDVARRLGLSRRSMQRRLAAADTAWSSVLDDTRRELAVGYVADDGYTFSEITFLLGFADTSSFTRAFKRWAGETPRAYRQRCLRIDPA